MGFVRSFDPIAVVDAVLQASAPMLPRNVRLHPIIDRQCPARMTASSEVLFESLLLAFLDTGVFVTDPALPLRNLSIELSQSGNCLSVRLDDALDVKPSPRLLALIEHDALTLDGRTLRVPMESWQDPQDVSPQGHLALLLIDSDTEMRSLASRLNRLGVPFTTSIDSPGIDCVFVDQIRDETLDVLSKRLGAGPGPYVLHDPEVEDAPSGPDRNWIAADSPLSQVYLEEQFRAIRMARQASGNTVLFVDDNLQSLRLLERQVIGFGYQALLAGSGADALRLLESHDLNLVFMDVQMAGMSGIATTREMIDRGVDTPVIGLTAHLDDAQARDCLEAGMREVVQKPLSAESFAAIASRHVPTANAVDTRQNKPLPVFDPALALERAGQKPELAIEFMEMFMAGLDEDMALVNQASGDPMALRAAVHRLRGALAYCGLPRLEQAARTLEESLAEGATDVGDGLRLLNAEVAALRAWHRDNPNFLSAIDEGG